jgi:leucyl-tRNA synthetase
MLDLGLVKHSEPIARLFTQGMVQKGGVAMSKSRGNVVGAEEMAEKYGADTGRLYTLFAAPPEKDLEWSEESIEGAWRFLNRVYRMVEKHAGEVRSVGQWNFDPKGMSEQERDLVRFTYKTMRRVTQDFETRWHFNSAIAQIMELVNEIYALEPLHQKVRPEIRKEVLQILTLLLAPMTPHLAEELWEMLGHDDGIWKATWPDLIEGQMELAKDEQVEIPVQVNGKVRGRMTVPAGASQEEVMKWAQADAGVAGHLAGKTVRKVIFVADKLLNIVVG